MTRGVRRASAFTLLEVMAAVLVLGMLYTVLANAAMHGLRSEGESRRRLQASLLADRALADLETQLSLGDVPPSGQQRDAVDAFAITVSVQPFDPTPLLPSDDPALSSRASRNSRNSPTSQKSSATSATSPTSQMSPTSRTSPTSKTSQTPTGAKTPLPENSLLKPPTSGHEGRLRRIDVVVAWQEADQEQRVSRTTFAFDTSGLEDVFPKSAGSAGAQQGLDGVSPADAQKAMEDAMKGMGGRP